MLEIFRERYTAALHAIQSGVKALVFDTGYPHKAIPDTHECSPKHLRVGVNSALIDSGAVAFLLVKKGIFTEEEYAGALADFAERDKASYEKKLSEMTGKNVSLV